MAEDDRFEEKPRKRRPPVDDDADEEDRPRRRKRSESTSDDGGVGYVIPYKNPPALIGYYLGIFGLLACFMGGLSLLSGTASIVLGSMGMVRASKNPQAHGRAHAITGIVLGVFQILAGCGWAAFWLSLLFSGGRR
jgi:hypothetical protein